jgi:hypothetical protein
MKYCSAKDIDQLVRRLLRQGWSFHRRAKHGQLRSPVGQATLCVPSTPSDRRAFLNFRRDVRRVLELNAAPNLIAS